MKGFRGVLLGICVVAGPVHALQEPAAPDTFVEKFDGARTQLAAAEAYINQGQYLEASEILQKLIDGFGERMIALAPEYQDLHVRVRDVCNKRISRMPPEGLEVYRRLVDSRAKALLAEYRASGRAPALQRLIAAYPNSSVGDAAFELAGDRAFAAGHWAQACLNWAAILPAELVERWTPTATLRTAADSRLTIANPSNDVGVVAAKWTAALLLMEEFRAAEPALAWYKERFPQASGRLAGREGKFVDLLTDLRGEVSRPSTVIADSRWSTFAGNSSRNRKLAEPIEVGDVERNWPIDEGSKSSRDPNGPASDEFLRGDDVPSYYPVVDGNQILLLTERFLQTLHLDTGKVESWHDFRGEQNGPRNENSVRQRYTLTLSGQKVFVRTGQESETFRQHRWMVQMPSVDSKLYCFDYVRQRLLWEIQARELTANNNYLFEGAPVVEGDRVYVAMTRVDAMAEASVACLDAQTGRLRWRKVVCESSNDPGSRVNTNHNLLCLADGGLFFCTNLGAVAALDSEDGAVRWIVTYPRGRRQAAGSAMYLTPELNPCVFHHGRVFVAPADSIKMYCLHAQTGQKLWEVPWAISHILGVGSGNLIVTGNRVWGLDVDSGKIRWYWPQNTAVGHGRGLLAGDFVYWPTKTELHILDQNTGQKARPTVPLSDRFRLRGGNLAVAGRNLILAQSDRVVALAPYAKMIDRLKTELVSAPDSAPLHWKLAEAAAANEDFELAIEHFRQAAATAKPTDRVDAESLALAAGRRLSAVHRDYAEHWRRANKPAMVERELKAAFETAPEADRLEVAAAIVEHFKTSGDAKAAAEWLMRIAVEPALADSRIPYSGRTRVSGRIWATAALVELRNARPDLGDFAVPDADSARIDSRKIKDVLRTDGALAALIDAKAALRIALEHERNHRLRDAALAFSRLERLAEPASTERLEAILGQARIYEELGYELFELRCLHRFEPNDLARPMPRQESDLLVGGYVADRKAAIRSRSSGFAAVDGRLTRLNEIRSEDRITLVRGLPPSRELEVYLQSSSQSVACCDAATGKVRWERSVAKPIHWASYGPVGLIVSSEDRFYCLGYESGDSLWETAIEADGASVDGILHVRNLLVAARKTRVFAVDVEDGRLTWEYLPSGGSLQPGLRSIGEWAAFWSHREIIVVDPIRGTAVAELARGDDSARPAVAAVGSKIVYSSDRSTLVAHDVNTGAQAWSLRIAWPSTEGPKLMASADRLFLLVDGYELSSIDVAKGVEVWRKRVGPKPARIRDDAIALIDHAVMIGGDGWLQARSMRDGESLWSQPLPEGFQFESFALPAWESKNDRLPPLLFAAASPSETLVGAFSPEANQLTQMLVAAGIPRPDLLQAAGHYVVVGHRGRSHLLSLRGDDQ